jgi:uncharacterized paraquat-inducible protein A
VSAAIDPGGTGIAGTLTCPGCAAPVAPEQSWCLRCGTAARTRLAPTPNWRLPLALAAIAVVLALAVLAWAFVALTRDSGPSADTSPPTASQPTTPAPAAQP